MTDPLPAPSVTNWGPADGPIHDRDHPPALGVDVAGAPAPTLPVGSALCRSWVADKRGAGAMYRLIVGGSEREGLYICMEWVFVSAERRRGGGE